MNVYRGCSSAPVLLNLLTVTEACATFASLEYKLGRSSYSVEDQLEIVTKRDKKPKRLFFLDVYIDF